MVPDRDTRAPAAISCAPAEDKRPPKNAPMASVASAPPQPSSLTPPPDTAARVSAWATRSAGQSFSAVSKATSFVVLRHDEVEGALMGAVEYGAAGIGPST